MNQLTDALIRHKFVCLAVVVAAVVIVANLVAMQFTDRVSWGAFDFALMTVLLLGTGLALELAMAAFRRSTHKVAIGAGVVVAASVVFIELGVGLVGTPLAGS